MKNSPIKIVTGALFLIAITAFCLLPFKDYVLGNDAHIDYQKASVALIGIIGVILYLFKLRIFFLFLGIWILLQIFIITQPAGGQVISVIDFHLLFEYGFIFERSFQGDLYTIGINVVPLAFIPLMFILPNKTTLIGEEFMLKQYRENDWLLHKLPQVVKVLDVIRFSGNKEWVVVHLSKGITFEENKYYHALIKAKDYMSIRKRNAKQIAYFRLFDGHKNPGNNLSLQEFPFIDWVVVE